MPHARRLPRDHQAVVEGQPGHLPIMVLIEAKSDRIPDPLDLGFVEPLPFDFEALDTIDAEIYEHWLEGA